MSRTAEEYQATINNLMNEISKLEANIDYLDKKKRIAHLEKLCGSYAIEKTADTLKIGQLENEIADLKHQLWLWREDSILGQTRVKNMQLEKDYAKLKLDYDGLVGLNHCVKGILEERGPE